MPALARGQPGPQRKVVVCNKFVDAAAPRVEEAVDYEAVRVEEALGVEIARDEVAVDIGIHWVAVQYTQLVDGKVPVEQVVGDKTSVFRDKAPGEQLVDMCSAAPMVLQHAVCNLVCKHSPRKVHDARKYYQQDKVLVVLDAVAECAPEVYAPRRSILLGFGQNSLQYFRRVVDSFHQSFLVDNAVHIGYQGAKCSGLREMVQHG